MKVRELISILQLLDGNQEIDVDKLGALRDSSLIKKPKRTPNFGDGDCAGCGKYDKAYGRYCSDCYGDRDL